MATSSDRPPPHHFHTSVCRQGMYISPTLLCGLRGTVLNRYRHRYSTWQDPRHRSRTNEFVHLAPCRGNYHCSASHFNFATGSKGQKGSDEWQAPTFRRASRPLSNTLVPRPTEAPAHGTPQIPTNHQNNLESPDFQILTWHRTWRLTSAYRMIPIQNEFLLSLI